MRFRYNQLPMVFQERRTLPDCVACKDPRCRSTCGMEGHVVEPLKHKDLAFGLLYTSRTVSEEARAIFYGRIHFVFGNRFDLHMFLTNLRKTARFIKSVTFSWLKSNGPHTKEIKQDFKDWSLRFKMCYGPALFTSIRSLAKACPGLEFLEMIDTMPNIPIKDARELESQQYKEWTLVKRFAM